MSASKWTNEFLDSMRLTGDILADPVAEIIWKKRNRPVMADLRFLSTNFENPLSKNVAIISQDLGLDDMEKQVITEYFNHFENLGRLYTSDDLKDFEVSSQLFNRYGYLFTSLLFFKSLPGGYMCPNPAFVLHSTKLLEDFAARRVMETAQFVFAVNTPDWYQSGSRGLMAIERVRLMHAGMRVSLLQQKEPGKEWNLSKGTPINQEDLTLTNHLFSLAVIDGLDAMGVHLSEEERRSIFNTWQKIGAAMGVSEFMLNSSYDDARSQYKKILKRSVSIHNPSGPPLTNALLKAMDEITMTDIPINILEDITSYFMNDARAYQSLGIHKPSIWVRGLERTMHYILSIKVWHRTFDHNKTHKLKTVVTKIGNFILVKKYHLGKLLIIFPGMSPLEAFSKSVLMSLRKKDMNNFKNGVGVPGSKQLYISEELLKSWGMD